MRVLGIIPARGGSKGIPRKNLVDVDGKPLIAYTIEAALAATKLADVVVSTEDAEIAEVARGLGAEVPFMRPASLATDDSPTLSVVQHICAQLAESGRCYDAICLLQPTSPERHEGLINSCIKKFELSDADSLVTLAPVPHKYNPMWVYWQDDAGQLELSTGGVEPLARRQLLPPAYIRDGRIYLARTETVMRDGTLFGTNSIGVPIGTGVNIDAPDDLELFRKAVKKK